MNSIDIESIIKDNEKKVEKFLENSKMNYQMFGIEKLTPRDKGIRHGHNRIYTPRGTYLKYFENYIL
jgi:hypothetical protein